LLSILYSLYLEKVDNKIQVGTIIRAVQYRPS
jgi:hypothetical protein